MGKVGSSTIAQKHNPSSDLLLISFARLLSARLPMMLGSMVRTDEADSSATNVADVAVPEIAILAASVAETLARLVTGFVVHEDAMQRNIEITNGLIVSEAPMMQLSYRIGRHEAHRSNQKLHVFVGTDH